MSCKKAQAVLDEAKIKIDETVDARKEKIDQLGAASVFGDSAVILVAKGNKILEYSNEQVNSADFLGEIIGRSGTLRAPTLKFGKKATVGYNDELLAEAFKTGS